MVNARQKITIQGEGVELLITPSLYSAKLTAGMDLTLHNPDDAGEILGIYVKHAYLAYRHALEVAEYEGRPAPRRVYDLADFEAWAVGEGRTRFGEFIRDFVFLKTGKTLDELAEGGEGKKKLTARRRWPFTSPGKRGATGS